MGIFQSTHPQPISVTLIHPHPKHRSIPGYVEENNYRLNYNLIHGYHTVSQLLGMTQQYGAPTGNGIIGFTRNMYEQSSNNRDVDMLSLDNALYDGDTLYLVVV